jgi:alanine racemase
MLPSHTPHIEIDLDKLVHNLNQVREKLGTTNSIIAVVKDNAYGLGAPVITQTLEKEGVGFFAVACMNEAKELRTHKISSPILVLGFCSQDEIVWASSNDVHVTLNDLAQLNQMAELDCKVKLHINVDTGMGRLGLLKPETDKALKIISSSDTIELEGIFTHFAHADVPDSDRTSLQYEQFNEVLAKVKDSDLSPRYIHCSNSAAICRFQIPGNYYVRPGILLYGSRSDPTQNFDIDLTPIASLKASIIKIKTVPAGTSISYGGTYITKEETRIATVPIGYTHGLPRALSNKGEVLIRGRRFPIVGKVTMDHIMIDIGSDSDIAVGDEVVAMGRQGNETISPDDIALLSETVSYEILTWLCNRIDRFYYRDSKIVCHEQNIIK